MQALLTWLVLISCFSHAHINMSRRPTSYGLRKRQKIRTKCSEDGPAAANLFKVWREKSFTNDQVRSLKSHAQRLKANRTMPKILVRGEEASSWNLSAASRSLSSSKSCRFISIKFEDLAGKSNIRRAAEDLAKLLDADIVQVVGHTVVLCRGIGPEDPIVNR
mmetsp:Transcript_14112/g.21430  ORF Transcript_14112/g.21430 Transcript_14112/m.21430 type:complete len:163 (-) Transcript_14112:55-543(-)